MIFDMEHVGAILLLGAIASGAMATLLEGAQLTGVTRMSLPFLFGAFFRRERRPAIVAGYILYLTGGLLFAFVYGFVFISLSIGGMWHGLLAGTACGFVHGIFLVTVFLPLLPYVHPRLASDFDGPDALGKIEPPGPFGLNYGRATPVSTIVSQCLYGAVFGAGFGSALAV